MPVPKVIVDLHEYRAGVVEKYTTLQTIEILEDVISDDKVQVTLDLPEKKLSAKERTNYALLQLYYQKGYKIFRDVCYSLKENPGLNSSDFGIFKGEVAEVFLYVTALAFIEKFKLDYKVYLSLVIPKYTGIQGETTELDLVLVSKNMIVVFEAKSYGGDKKIKDICTISRKSGSRDIYQQNAMHIKSLFKLIEKYNINGRGVKSVLFSYSLGKLEDIRDKRYKELMPVVTENNLLAFLTTLSKLNTECWTQEALDIIEETSKKYTMEDHMKHINSTKRR